MDKESDLTTPAATKQRKLNDRARKREDAARRRKLAAEAKAAAEEAKAELAAPAAQRNGTSLRGARLDFDGKTHTVHRANPIRTMAERSRNKEHPLFRKVHADAAQKLIALHDLCYGGVSHGVGSYGERAGGTPTSGTLSAAVLASVNAQISAKIEIEALHTHFGSSWGMLVAIVINGITISSYAESVHMREEVAAGYLVSLLDRLIERWEPQGSERSRIRTIEFSTQVEN